MAAELSSTTCQCPRLVTFSGFLDTTIVWVGRGQTTKNWSTHQRKSCRHMARLALVPLFPCGVVFPTSRCSVHLFHHVIFSLYCTVSHKLPIHQCLFQCLVESGCYFVLGKMSSPPFSAPLPVIWFSEPGCPWTSRISRQSELLQSDSCATVCKAGGSADFSSLFFCNPVP